MANIKIGDVHKRAEDGSFYHYKDIIECIPDEDVDKNGMTEEMKGSYEVFVDGMVECFKKIHAFECQQTRKRNKAMRSRSIHEQFKEKL